ncbi:MAG TPA: glycosyltransferase family 4 protein [Gemmatimonadaceae bacterium]|nr:glycosyltransferase family 4 protein [Gemmatimonadaceae bacterium]
MRILIINQFFDPEPTFKGLVFARELQRRGHDVEALTGFPHYPGGAVYPGYRIRLVSREEHDGVRVNRVAVFPSHDQSALHRIATYGSFALTAAALGPLVTRRPDVVYVYHPPVTVALAALSQRLFRDVPFVYDIQDLWPDTLRATGMVRSDHVLRAVGGWCDYVYAKAARLVVLSPGFRDRLIERGVPPAKIDVIYNWCDEAAIAPPSHVTPARDERVFTLLFAGTMGLAQGLDAVLDAAAMAKGALPGVRFAFVGGGVERDRLRQRAEREHLDNVVFHDRRPMSEMGGVLAAADALLVHLRDDPLFRITIPGKVQAYLAAGRPVLIGVRGDARALVEESGAGYGFTPEDPASLLGALRRMLSRTPAEREAMGRAGQRFYDSRLSLRVGADAFEQTFSRAVGRIH